MGTFYTMTVTALLDDGEEVEAGAYSAHDKGTCTDWLASISRKGFSVPGTDRYIPGHRVKEFRRVFTEKVT